MFRRICSSSFDSEGPCPFNHRAFAREDSRHASAVEGSLLVAGTSRASAREDNHPLVEGTSHASAEEDSQEVGTVLDGSLEAGIGLVVVGNGLKAEGTVLVGSL